MMVYTNDYSDNIYIIREKGENMPLNLNLI